jgi:hypothetical protein
MYIRKEPNASVTRTLMTKLMVEKNCGNNTTFATIMASSVEFIFLITEPLNHRITKFRKSVTTMQACYMLFRRKPKFGQLPI